MCSDYFLRVVLEPLLLLLDRLDERLLLPLLEDRLPDELERLADPEDLLLLEEYELDPDFRLVLPLDRLTRLELPDEDELLRFTFTLPLVEDRLDERFLTDDDRVEESLFLRARLTDRSLVPSFARESPDPRRTRVTVVRLPESLSDVPPATLVLLDPPVERVLGLYPVSPAPNVSRSLKGCLL